MLTYFLRGVVADSEDTIKAAADYLGGNGFINYFGLQLQCLKKCPRNYLQALKAILVNLSFRIDQVVAGDLVYCKDVPPEILADAVDEFEDDICKEIEDCGVLAEVSEVALPEEKYNMVKASNLNFS
ncbi:hypothetical protein GIB67_020192 [Kingdonia uniflora]|uniref:Uncharacterized protein n=1 Tax=Kingdonia uniflora TaxID=39325 RepID=A0A7J7NU93_9MAGN|nr:hypothetical protein GIB67_020192 [Kingdonia uniflora]